MGKYNRLLVGVDGSDASLHALQESFKLSKNWVTVVTVAPSYAGDLRIMGVSGVHEKLREPCDTALARAQEAADAAGALIRPLCAVGEPYECLVEEADAGSRDLIVLGVKGNSFVERALLGSVTRRVVGFTRKDVLIIPLHSRVGWKRLMVASDCSQGSQVAIDRALELAAIFDSELTVVTAMDLPIRAQGEALGVSDAVIRRCHDYVGEVQRRGVALNLSVHGVVRPGQAYQVITDLAREGKSDLIIMGSHGHTGLSRLLMGGVTERVIGHAPCPVLVVKRTT
jgi:nucleotide-binding universal stress UspA family protein